LRALPLRACAVWRHAVTRRDVPDTQLYQADFLGRHYAARITVWRDGIGVFHAVLRAVAGMDGDWCSSTLSLVVHFFTRAALG